MQPLSESGVELGLVRQPQVRLDQAGTVVPVPADGLLTYQFRAGFRRLFSHCRPDVHVDDRALRVALESQPRRQALVLSCGCPCPATSHTATYITMEPNIPNILSMEHLHPHRFRARLFLAPVTRAATHRRESVCLQAQPTRPPSRVRILMFQNILSAIPLCLRLSHPTRPSPALSSGTRHHPAPPDLRWRVTSTRLEMVAASILISNTLPSRGGVGG